ncbi:hypothetical protein FB446DRAFT_180670 [Lentinula raphanica]|nr:hypothetical protein FB446DRAFT_180670 [Lentinula raphanica]
MHLNFIRLVFLCSSLVHAVTAMPVITLPNAQSNRKAEGLTFTQSNMVEPQTISTVTSEWSSVSRRSPQPGFLDSEFPRRHRKIPNFSPNLPNSNHRNIVDLSNKPGSIVAFKFESAATTRKIQEHIHARRKLLTTPEVTWIVAELLDMDYEKLYGEGPDFEGSLEVSRNTIASFKIRITVAPPEMEKSLQLPCDVSIDLIGSTVAAANFGNGRWIFLGLRGMMLGELRGQAVWFTQEPTTTSESYGEIKVATDTSEENPSQWPFRVDVYERKVIGFEQS